MALDMDQIYNKEKQTKKKDWSRVYEQSKSPCPHAVQNHKSELTTPDLTYDDILAACEHLTIGTVVNMVTPFGYLGGDRRFVNNAIPVKFKVCGIYPHHVVLTDGVIQLSMDKFELYSQRNSKVLCYGD